MVDDVLSSCYASSDHDLAHIGMAPLRWFPEIIMWLFGDDTEASGYVESIKHIQEMMSTHSVDY